MPGDSGSRYNEPNVRGIDQLEKPENLSFLAKMLFELSQKNKGVSN